MIYVGRISFWACSCYGLDKIGGALQRRRRLLDIARLSRVIFNHVWCSAKTMSMLSVSQTKCVTSLMCSLLSAVQMISRRGKHLVACDLQQLSYSQLFQLKIHVCVTSVCMFSSLWCGWFLEGETFGSVILNSSNILNYFNRWYVSPLYVFSPLSGVDDFRKGKHLSTNDPHQLSCAQLFQQTICVTSLCMFSSLWCKWFQEGETSYSLWSSTALIFSIIFQQKICVTSVNVLFSLVLLISGRGNIWQPVILNSSHILNYFNRRTICVTSLCIFSSVWCGWFQERANIWHPVWSWKALIFSIISTDDMCHLSMYEHVLFSLVRMISGRVNIWQLVIINISHDAATYRCWALRKRHFSVQSITVSISLWSINRR